MYNNISNNFNKVTIIFNEIKKIVEMNIIDLKNYTVDATLTSESLIILINNLVNNILINTVKSYKHSYYEPLVEFIINIIKQKNIDLSYGNYNILKIINSINNAHIYLKKIKGHIINNKYYNLDILFTAANKGTLPTFLFWWMLLKNTALTHDNYLQLLCLSIVNCDDRIFKYVIDIKNVDNLGAFYINNNIESVIIELLKTAIPKKFKLKRIKLLSTKVNLIPYYSIMIEQSYSLILLNNLSKYYYNDFIHFHTMKNIFIHNNNNFEFLAALEFYNNLKTNKEKNYFCILCSLDGYTHEKIKSFNCDFELLSNNYSYILSEIVKWLDNDSTYIYDNKILNHIFKYYIQNDYIKLYIDNENISSNNIYKYTKFYVDKNKYNIHNIKVNRVLHFLRCIMKNKYNTKEKEFKFNFKPIINEIINFKPNLKCPVMRKGSLNYQLKEQEFNNIPPRHLLPMESIINKQFLIKEKADGILTKNIPKCIYPEILDIFEYEIKAEYIEDLNLYLIFDINIPNKTIYERQVYLRNLHYVTSSKKIVPNINNIDELITEIQEERELLSRFIKNTSEIKWYPKGSWKINMNNENYNNIIKVITGKSEHLNIILNGTFNCDGLILTPLDGSRELKIKPNHLQTIDLCYNESKWVDKENNHYNIVKMENKKYKNKIYRCYPFIDSDQILKYIPKEVRYDKKYPNSYQIIDQIQNIYKFNWESSNLLDHNSKKYYENKTKISDTQIITIINKNTQILESMISFIKPENNKKWLDLGCGNCKLFKYIKDKYYPKKYLGIDNDVDVLSKLYHLVDQYSETFNIYPSNLNLVWDKQNIWNSFNWNIKYDYIIANFSLMHFCNNIFWTQLNNITTKGSIFIFNLVKENSNWNYNNSYLKSNTESTEINFEWTHTSKFNEPLITETIISNYINSFNWKLIHINESNGPLTNCYKWYIIERL